MGKNQRKYRDSLGIFSYAITIRCGGGYGNLWTIPSTSLADVESKKVKAMM